MADRKFKDTEVGRIPVDWEVKRLGEIATITMGQSPSSTYYNTEFEGLPLIQGNADLVNRKTVQRIFTKQVTKRCKEGDIIVTVRAPVGKVGKATFDACIGRGVCAISYTNDYLYYYLMHIEEHWEKLSRGTTFDAVNSSDIQALLIPIPPLPEQKAIAKVLSDIDELIESIEKLIHKKKQIKQGAMQELLTGKKRLPGFSGKWEVKRLGELGVTYSGLSGKKKEDFNSGNSYYITFLNVLNNPVIDLKQVEKVRVSKWENQNLVRKGDIFFNTSSETPEEVGMCSVLMEDKPNLYLNSFCFGYRLYDGSKCDALYLTSYLRSDLGRKMFSTIAQGSTRYNLSKKEFNNIAIPLPPLPEQKAIAQILSDMDAEIEALEKKLDKYKKIKEGMMEKLLTGQVRLV